MIGVQSGVATSSMPVTNTYSAKWTTSTGTLKRTEHPTTPALWFQAHPTAEGLRIDVIAPPPGELFSETNNNSVAILLSYGTARVLLAGDAEAREEEYMTTGA
jgi:beta-lactamase superfamily II metal-dependent hydrolase